MANKFTPVGITSNRPAWQTPGFNPNEEVNFTPVSVIPKKGIADKLIEFGIKQYVKNKDTPLATNQKIFYDTFINNNKNVITEKDYNKTELDYLKNVLKSQLKNRIESFSGIEEEFYKQAEKLKKLPKKELSPGALESITSAENAFKEYRKSGKINSDLFNIINGNTDYFQKQTITSLLNKKYSPDDADYTKYLTPFKLGIFDYADYAKNKTESEIDKQISEQRNLTEYSPEGMIHTTLGRFKANFDPNTQTFNIKDNYDFGQRSLFVNKNNAPYGDTRAVEAGGNPLYNIIRGYAGRMQPEGVVVPREFNINLGY